MDELILKFRELLELVEDVINDKDDTGCDGVYVVGKDPLDQLEDFIVNYCGEDDLPEVWEIDRAPSTTYCY